MIFSLATSSEDFPNVKDGVFEARVVGLLNFILLVEFVTRFDPFRSKWC